MAQVDKKKDEKKNTDAWKMKQDEKKKKMEVLQTNNPDQKESGKGEQKKKQKAKAKKQEKAESKQPEQLTKQPLPPTPPALIPAAFKRLERIDDRITQKDRSLNRGYQQQLIFKYMEQYVTKNDIVLYIGDREWNPPCQQIYVSGFNNCPKAELVCRYSDITYFFESGVTKVFVEAAYAFGNGSFLAKKGALNLVLLASHYNIPVVACAGSWNFNGWTPLTENSIADRYGPVADEFDWIQAKNIKSLVLEVGSINPKQISTYPSIIYKGVNLLDW